MSSPLKHLLKHAAIRLLSTALSLLDQPAPTPGPVPAPEARPEPPVAEEAPVEEMQAQPAEQAPEPTDSWWPDRLGLNGERVVCRLGHPWTGENLIIKGGAEYCKTCKRETAARQSANRKRPDDDQIAPPPSLYCIVGHALTPSNRTANGGCRACSRDSYRRKRDEALAQPTEPAPAPEPEPEPTPVEENRLPGPDRTHCKHGHPWVPENVYNFHDSRTAYCKTCLRENRKRRKDELDAAKNLQIERWQQEAALAPAEPQACRQGHLLTPENTYVTPVTGVPVCRACMDERRRALTPEPSPTSRATADQLRAFLQPRTEMPVPAELLDGPPADLKTVKRCPQHHRMTVKNTYVDDQGEAHCRECRRTAQRKVRREAKTAVASLPDGPGPKDQRTSLIRSVAMIARTEGITTADALSRIAAQTPQEPTADDRRPDVPDH